MRALVFTLTFALALASLTPGLARAQEMTVQQFLTRTERIPRNPLALLSPDVGRLKRVYEQALGSVVREQMMAQREGRRPATCIPSSFSTTNAEALAYFNAIPRQRREAMTVTQGVRSWMAQRFPCPA
jgi:hypothetical protein